MKAPTIIFQNDDLMVIDKPVDLMVHGEGEDPSGTLVEWFLNLVPEAQGVGEPRVAQTGQVLERSGIVHRLDRDTSGVMVLAKNQPTFNHLKLQFQERKALKEYRAIVYGEMKERWGTITRRIGRNAKDWKLRSAERGAQGQLRDATTDWKCITSGLYKEEPFSYLQLLPKTGRTHQLRVHLKSMGRPIVGDVLYAPTMMERSNNLELNRLALHAFRLTLTNPDGKIESYEAPLPDSLNEAVARIAD